VVAPDEVLIAGRISVVYEGKDVTKDLRTLLKDDDGEVFELDLDESGVFLARLPAGSYYVPSIFFEKVLGVIYAHPLEPGQITLSDLEGGRAYDVGALSIDWTGGGFRKGALFGLLGVAIDAMVGDGEVYARVEADPKQTAEAVFQRFGTRPTMAENHFRLSSDLVAAPAPVDAEVAHRGNIEERLERLVALRDKEALTEAEFQAAKQQLLKEMGAAQ